MSPYYKYRALPSCCHISPVLRLLTQMKLNSLAGFGSLLLAISTAKAQYLLGLGTGDITGPIVEVSISDCDGEQTLLH